MNLLISNSCFGSSGMHSIQETKPVSDCMPYKFVGIPGNYGAHQVSNTASKAIGLFEIYFEPEIELSNLNLPIPFINSDVDHVIDTVPTGGYPIKISSKQQKEKSGRKWALTA